MPKEGTFENGGIRVEVQNIGGISDTEVILSEGVTLISGKNASNKSSLLRSLVGVLGGPLPPVKSDTNAGEVRLTIDDTEYFLELAQEAGETVVTGRNLYSDASDLCELFVALTEMNPIRQAVLAGDDLYDLLMQPVDTEEIEAEIQRLSTEKKTVDERLDDLDAMENRLPGLQTRQNNLQEELAEVEASLRSKRDAIEEIEAETEPGDDAEMEDLKSKRSERNEIRTRIRTHEEAIESLEEELDEVTERLGESDPKGPDTPLEEITDELEQLHHQKQQLTSTINALSPLVEMNTQVLDEAAEIPEAMTSDDVVAELDPASQSITCWTCGSTVERAQIAEQVEAVREIIREKRNQRDAITESIQSLTGQKRELEQRRDELDRLQDRRQELADEIERRKDMLAELRDEQGALETEIRKLQQQVEETRDEAGQLAKYYDDISDLEYQRGQLANDLEGIEGEISDIEEELSKRSEIEARRESVAEELLEQRELIDGLEQDLVATFNEVMQHVLDTLGYQSIEQIWVERLSTGDQASSQTEFELHVVRATEEGTVYDDTVDSLSKSEREVIGLVVALAGYLVHDVSREIPFIVVDAVEMFDADRIQGLMEHFGEHAEYVVAAILPEEQNELDGVYDTVSTSSFMADS